MRIIVHLRGSYKNNEFPPPFSDERSTIVVNDVSDWHWNLGDVFVVEDSEGKKYPIPSASILFVEEG